MEKIPKICVYDGSCHEKAEETIACGYRNYELFDQYFPDRNTKKKLLQWYLGKTLTYTNKYGEAYVAGDGKGVCCWLTPGNTEITISRGLLGGYAGVLLRYGRGFFKYIDPIETFTSRIHKKNMKVPHMYLWVLAVHPDHQGKGIGTCLVKSRLEKDDMKGLPCYLETHDKTNVPFYERLGFKCIEEVPVPGTPLTMYAMLRNGTG